MSDREIKVGFLISYDWELLRYSLPLIYQWSDKIFLAIDVNRRTWKGNHFSIPDSFFVWLRGFDKSNKISIYEDDFFVPNLTPMECETRERNMLAAFMGEEGWHVQLDTDEYFLNFDVFTENLKSWVGKDKVQINCIWINLYKKVVGGFLVISPVDKGYERFPCATNNPKYVVARNTKSEIVPMNGIVLHQSWAREEQEILAKLKNWGHADDFDSASYFALWQALDDKNYKYLKNLHPIWPELWPELTYQEGGDVSELIENMKRDICVFESKRMTSGLVGRVKKAFRTLSLGRN